MSAAATGYRNGVTEPSVPDRIEGRRRIAPTGRRRWVALALIPVSAALVLWVVYERDWGPIVVWEVVLPVNLFLAWTPPAVVDPTGIRRPWRRRSWLPWSEVDVVLGPQPGVAPFVRVRATDGNVLTLQGIPADRSEDVAALGQHRVEPYRDPAWLPAHRSSTDAEVASDTRRRAAALHQGWADLAAQQRPRR
jgi:hypothetical protein